MSLLLLCGDFNSKIGKSTIKEPCVCKYSRGFRNDSGQRLVDFCTTRQLSMSNSRFKYPARHITACQNIRERNGTNINFLNQIDYVICSMNKKHHLIGARSFSNTLVTSDHRLVICKSNSTNYIGKNLKSNKKNNCSVLINDMQSKKYNNHA